MSHGINSYKNDHLQQQPSQFGSFQAVEEEGSFSSLLKNVLDWFLKTFFSCIFSTQNDSNKNSGSPLLSERNVVQIKSSVRTAETSTNTTTPAPAKQPITSQGTTSSTTSSKKSTANNQEITSGTKQNIPQTAQTNSKKSNTVSAREKQSGVVKAISTLSVEPAKQGSTTVDVRRNDSVQSHLANLSKKYGKDEKSMEAHLKSWGTNLNAFIYDKEEKKYYVSVPSTQNGKHKKLWLDTAVTTTPSTSGKTQMNTGARLESAISSLRSTKK